MAYGARLESVLGASPRGFESPILRQFSFSCQFSFSFSRGDACASACPPTTRGAGAPARRRVPKFRRCARKHGVLRPDMPGEMPERLNLCLQLRLNGVTSRGTGPMRRLVRRLGLS